MNASSRSWTIGYYTRLVGRHGNSVRALNWGSRRSQRTRFRVLSEIADLSRRSVLDVGCGLADLNAWLAKNAREARYTGIDVTPAMIEAAARRFPSADLRVADTAALSRRGEGTHDYVFASGIFSKRRSNSFGDMKRCIRQMFRLARRGVAFNALSSLAPGKEKAEFHADPVTTLRYCLRLSPWAVLRHDYHPRDFTIYMYKQGPR
jgi:ubiquinone/menaquinone biosynthesis C-methylase UbiE